MLESKEKIGVVLFQLGGPDSLDSVEPFLFNLFYDPDIIDFPGAFIARKFLARLISKQRSKKVVENYRMIGGKSPILGLTKSQANCLEQELNKKIYARVFIAMRYWHPSTEEVIQEIKKGSFEKVILLPLYPQYSKATTGSSLNEWNRVAAKYNFNISAASIQSFHNNPLYISAIVENTNKAFGRLKNNRVEEIDLVFSAHGTPLSLVTRGDPYKNQIEETVQLVMKVGGWKSPHHLCYQSKVGPIKWLEPSLLETIHSLARNNRRHLIIIPISFVTDHIETLHEIDIEIRKESKRVGVESFEIIPALNNSPKFIQCLTQLVIDKI